MTPNTTIKINGKDVTYHEIVNEYLIHVGQEGGVERLKLISSFVSELGKIMDHVQVTLYVVTPAGVAMTISDGEMLLDFYSALLSEAVVHYMETHIRKEPLLLPASSLEGENDGRGNGHSEK